MKTLSSHDRLQLLKFVCSFAWADLEVKSAERKVISNLVKKLHLDADETAQVQAWLKVPPPPEEVDPTHIPKRHREVFLDAIRSVVTADGDFSEEERENLYLFTQLLGE